jgi:hypothetical protein
VIEEEKESIKETLKEKVDLSKRKPLVNPFHKGDYEHKGKPVVQIIEETWFNES